jgi:hypothetical protein
MFLTSEQKHGALRVSEICNNMIWSAHFTLLAFENIRNAESILHVVAFII